VKILRLTIRDLGLRCQMDPPGEGGWGAKGDAVHSMHSGAGDSASSRRLAHPSDLPIRKLAREGARRGLKMCCCCCSRESGSSQSGRRLVLSVWPKASA
jgi:hypothetical protein